jgi:hypothetical protein
MTVLFIFDCYSTIFNKITALSSLSVLNNFWPTCFLYNYTNHTKNPLTIYYYNLDNKEFLLKCHKTRNDLHNYLHFYIFRWWGVPRYRQTSETSNLRSVSLVKKPSYLQGFFGFFSTSHIKNFRTLAQTVLLSRARILLSIFFIYIVCLKMLRKIWTTIDNLRVLYNIFRLDNILIINLSYWQGL